MSAQTPPEKCPICGATEDGRTFSGDRADLAIEFGCGVIWHLSPAPRWSGDCYHATTAALRCGATLHPTAREQATAALVKALFAERKAWQKLAALTVGDDTSADACLLACQERDAAAEVLDDAAIAYLATVTP